MKRIWKLSGKLAEKVRIGNLPQGHHDHMSGAGTHADKRTRRQRDRNSANRKAINDQLN